MCNGKVRGPSGQQKQSWPPVWMAAETARPPIDPPVALIEPVAHELEPEPKPSLDPAVLVKESADGAGCARRGSHRYVEVPIHGGRSTRRDCGKCGTFISFPIWYGSSKAATT